MTGRWTLLITALAVGLFSASLLIGADAALEKTVEKAKEKRQAEIDKAGAAYHTQVEKANAALVKAYEGSIAKRKKDDAKLEAITTDMEAVKAGGTPSTTDTGDKLLDGAIKRRTTELETADKAFKAAVARANTTLETSYNQAIAGYKRKSDARGDELNLEIATIKAEAVTPVKGEGSASASSAKGNNNLELIKAIGTEMVNAEGKKVSSKELASKEYVLVYYSAHWCPPCRAFTPKLVEFHNSYAKEGKLEVVFVSADRSEKDMLDYMSGAKMPWLGVPFGKGDEQGLAAKHGVTGYPHLVLLDKEGKILSSAVQEGKYVGPYKVLDDAKAKIGLK